MWILLPFLVLLYALAPAFASADAAESAPAGPPMIAADDPGWKLQSSEEGIALYRCQVKGRGVVPVEDQIAKRAAARPPSTASGGGRSRMR